MMEKLIITKLNELKIVFLGLALCLLLLTLRLKATQSFFLLFLGWNIILALVPYILSFALLANKKWQQRWYFWIPIAVAWLLFLPNAPYLITDLQHLRHTPESTLWYDIILFTSFIWYALLLMVLSIRHMESLLPKKMPATQRLLSTVGLFVLCGFGIYLGRYLRWNSWGIIQAPGDLFIQIWEQVRYPRKNILTWLVTFGYGALLTLIYVGSAHIKIVKKSQ